MNHGTARISHNMRGIPLRTILLTIVATLAAWLLSRIFGSTGAATASAPAGHEAAIAIHLVGVGIAVPLGAWVLWRPKGTRPHRLLGRLWAAAMLAVAISSYWLRSFGGGFSFIHLFSVLVLVSVPLAIFYARRGNIQAHLSTMRGLYVGLLVAGGFALLPGRLVGTLLFG